MSSTVRSDVAVQRLRQYRRYDSMNLTHDVHSYAQPEKVRVRHVVTGLNCFF